MCRYPVLVPPALVAVLIASAPSLRAALPARQSPVCTLGPEAAATVSGLLDGAEGPASDARIERDAVLFAASPGDVPASLVATHRRNLPADGPTPAWSDGELALFVAAGADDAWSREAARLGPALRALPWRCPQQGPAPMRPAWSWVAWGALMLGAGLALGAAARRAAIPRRPVVAGALGLTALSLALRAARWSPFPLHYIEIERVPPVPRAGTEVYAALAAPFTALWPDGVAAQAAVNVALGALAPLLLVALGARWQSRAAGWVAGLLLATAPLQLRFAGCSDASVGLTTLLLAAVLAFEGALASGGLAAAAGAGLLWAVALAVRPDAPAYLALPAALALADRRRAAALLRAPASAAAVALPVLAGLAWTWYAAGARGPRPPDLPAGTLWGFVDAAWGSARDLVLHPALRPWLETVAAGAGLLVASSRVRASALLAGLALPALAYATQFGRPFGDGPLALEEAKSALYGQPYWLLAAGALLAAPFAPTSPGRRRLRPLAALGLIGWLASVWLARDTVVRPSPVQAEHAFLAERLPALPARAVVTILGRKAGYNAPAHVEHRVAQAGRALLAGAEPPPTSDGVQVIGRDTWESRALPGAPVFALRGWLAAADAPPAPFGAAPGCARIPVAPHPLTGHDLLTLCLSPSTDADGPSNREDAR